MTLARSASPADTRGAALVEFALIMPILFLIIFGVIDFGLIYSNSISVRQGVREAARQGVVGQFGGSCTLNATDITPSANIGNLMCLTKNRIGITPTSNVYVKVLFDSSYAVNNGLIVSAQTKETSLTGYMSPFIHGFLRTKVEMSIEQLSVGGTETAGEETPPAGATWSWCTAAGATP